MLGPSLALTGWGWTGDLPGDWLPSCPHTSTPQRSEWQLAACVHRPVGAGQAACLLFPGPSLVGRPQKYCVTQPKNSFPHLPPCMKEKPSLSCRLPWPPARPRSVISGELLSPGQQEPFFLFPAAVVGGLFQSPSTPKRPCVLPPDPGRLSQASALENRVGA